MLLTSPIVITPRLCAGVQVGPAFISIEYAGSDQDGRTRYRYFIDLPGYEYESTDLASGCQGGDLQSGLSSLLGFLSAYADSISYSQRTGRESDNADLFPAELADWATGYSDELSILVCELKETPELIVE